MTGRDLLLLLLAPLAAACADAPAKSLAVPEVDTLPGGVVSVMNHGPAAWNDTSGWKLVETLRIGGGQGDSIVLNNPRSVALDGAGRIYVVDQNPEIIKQFDRQGRLIRTIGREGGGPGEFRVAFIAVQDSFLIVHDPDQARTSVFDTSGTFLRSWPSQCCYWMPIVIDHDNRVYIPGPSPRDSGRMYIRYALDRPTADTLYLPPRREGATRFWTFNQPGRGTSMYAIPLSPRQFEQADPAGGFLTANSIEFSAALSRTGRDTVRIFGKDWTPNPVPLPRRQALVDTVVSRVTIVSESEARKIANLDDVPASAPAFNGITNDGSGNYWFQIDPGTDTQHTYFEVFDSIGVYLGRVAGPSWLVSYQMTWAGEEMAITTEDAEGNPVVIRYRIAGGE